MQLSFTLNLPSERRSPEENRKSVPPVSPLTPPHLQQGWDDRQSFLEPGPTYLAPGSGFFFGSTGSQTSIIDFLPSRLAGDRLIKQYHDAVHFIARVVHWPSFETQYDKFWANITQGIEPSGSLQAIVFAVMLSAVVSMNESDVTMLFSVSKRNLVASFQAATEVALGKANFLRTTKLETLQALVIYLIPMCRDEMSRAHSVLVGTAIRLAECMGLHRDPQGTYGLGPLESHVRRTLWCQLCFLDIRTAEAQGPRPLIRRDDFDSSFPLNVNDADVASGNPKESSGWTDMTFSKMRFECNEMHRVIWGDRSRLEKKQVTLTHVLGRIESFRKAMEAKYHPILNESIPLQKEAKVVMNLLLLRMHIMVLHRYHNSVWVRVPDRLRQIILSTGTQQMEDAVCLETDPVLQPWAWYCGAYQQWHTAFLLLVEVFSFPMRREADRIWRILDYVFETDPSMTREQKGRAILSGLRDRTGAYRDIRKIRAPVNMMSRIYAAPTQKPTEDSRTRLPLDFNSDPTPPASRTISGSAKAPHLSYGPIEYSNIVFSAQGSVSPTNSNYNQLRQVNSRSPYNASYAAPAVTAAGPASTSSFGQMTSAFADAPSPENWTFDAPSTFFMPQSYTNKPHRSQLPGEQTTQTSPPPSEATNSPDYYQDPSTGTMAGQGTDPNAWGGGLIGGKVGYPVPPPPGVSMDTQRPGFVSPVSSGGGAIEMKGSNSGLSPQAAGLPGMDTDMMMVDIDWVGLFRLDTAFLTELPWFNVLVLEASFAIVFILPSPFCLWLFPLFCLAHSRLSGAPLFHTSDGSCFSQISTSLSAYTEAYPIFRDAANKVSPQSEWDKIFPPEVNTGILNAPLTQQF
jgi:Fungal specific transcription factor domain